MGEEGFLMSLKNTPCKTCGTKFHYCHNCGYDYDLHPMSEGYCSWECLRKGGGAEYEEENENDME